MGNNPSCIILKNITFDNSEYQGNLNSINLHSPGTHLFKGSLDDNSVANNLFHLL
jgi:hypothetical protein